ncbi:LisH and RanBPM domains containing protein [Trifolium repens]|nr:LisH and RanBPM domains containing protein [Trifolium repens]
MCAELIQTFYTGHKPPVIFPSSTAAAYRTDPEWKSRRSFRVCTGGACPKGRGKSKLFGRIREDRCTACL